MPKLTKQFIESEIQLPVSGQRSELTKSDREHRLPLSDFLIALLKKRYIHRKNSEWVFQSIRLKDKHLSEGVGIVRRVRAKKRHSVHVP
jgi:integrase